jgi:hypothetical protein
MPDPQNLKLEPGRSYDFFTDNGVASARYWPKMWCDEFGRNCSLGNSGGPDQGCGKPGYGECAPPIDTKFEATFQARDAAQPGQEYDYVDVSLVDGFTLPFKLVMNGRCDAPANVVDCSGMTFASCPASEYLSTAGITADLKAVNPATGVGAGCYSPCTKLINPQWNNVAAQGRHGAEDPVAAPYCCPTPPESPEACRAGPVKDTAYVKMVHQMCSGVYGYAYDDGMGLIKCEATTTYEMTYYCPSPLSQPANVPLSPSPSPSPSAGGMPGAVPWEAIGWFPSLPTFINTAPSVVHRFTFGMLYTKEGHVINSSKRPVIAGWLLAALAVMMISFAVIAVRKWQRRAYRGVSIAEQEVRAGLSTDLNDV